MDKFATTTKSSERKKGKGRNNPPACGRGALAARASSADEKFYAEPSHPLISDGSVEDDARLIVERIKNELRAQMPHVPNAQPGGSMAPPSRSVKIAWRPNNYRREIAVKERKESTVEQIKKCSGCSPRKSNGLIFIRKADWPELPDGVMLQYGRRKLTAIYEQERRKGGKLHFVVEGDCEDALIEWMLEKRDEITGRLDRALLLFCKKFKVGLAFAKPKWQRYEDFIKGEEYIDKLPAGLIFHDSVTKKVYGDGVEFIKSGENDEPVLKVKNYLKNRAVENIAPEIAQELAATGALTAQFEAVLADFAATIKQSVEVQKITNEQLRSLVAGVSALAGLSSPNPPTQEKGGEAGRQQGSISLGVPHYVG